jgi:hypothetical protein
MKIKCYCPIHGIFLKRKDRANEECPSCVWLKRTKTTTSFIQEAKEIHGDTYDYRLTKYKQARSNVIIICKEHGKFLQTPDNHLSKKQGCPKCKSSKGEKEVEHWFLNHNTKFIEQKRFEGCRGKVKPLPFDFYLPEHNTCIEYQGKQHYDKDSRFYSKELIKNDKTKARYCRDNNIRLVVIPYWENINDYLISANLSIAS